jgi:uncharacterized metal-binding protein YceD (DUF177 family)
VRAERFAVVEQEPIAPEFSRVVLADSVGTDGLRLDLAAAPEECAALARRLELEALSNLAAHPEMRRLDKRKVRLAVTFGADVLQLCVVTLEPVASHVADRFEVVFAPPEEEEDRPEVFVDVATEDPPEPLLEGQIDIGEMVAQHLSLQIDPYPKAPDTESGPWRTEDGDEAKSNPFRRLRGVKRWA